MSSFVRPTTADPRRKFYALCTECGWQTFSTLFAGVHQAADAHVAFCRDAAVEVDLVQYIGHEKTPDQRQLIEGRSNQLRSQLQ